MSDPLETRQDLRPVSSAAFVTNWMETLENRRLLSGSGQILMQPDITLDPLASAGVQGYSPAQIDAAYGFNSISLANGVKGDGSGQTIAIVDAYDDPNIASDLKTFDKEFSLSDPTFTKVSQTGSTTKLPSANADWSGEISLDVEWAHAVAPKAKIELVEANSDSLSDLLAAVDYARHASGVSVVSMSWGTNEFMGESNYDSYFTTPSGHQGVTFVASSGDDGSFGGPSWPSISDNVLSVGGTTLRLTSTGSVSTETAWNDSTGGVSEFEREPSYQSQYGNVGGRAGPDVSLNANPETGYAVYDSVSDDGMKGWQVFGGTSAGAPQWAALVAIADQGRALEGAGSLDGATGTLPAVYSLYTLKNNAYSDNFRDITSGGSFFDRAGVDYDFITGLGSPRGNAVVNSLAGFGLKIGGSGSTTSTSTSSVKKTKASPQIERAPSHETIQAFSPTIASSLPTAQAQPTLFSDAPVTPAAPIETTGRAIGGFGSNAVGIAGRIDRQWRRIGSHDSERRAQRQSGLFRDERAHRPQPGRSAKRHASASVDRRERQRQIRPAGQHVQPDPL